MGTIMGEPELSKRIDDLHRRFDDQRADQLQLRQEMQTGFAGLRQEMGQLRQEMQRGGTGLRQEIGLFREALDRKSKLVVQVVVVGTTLLGLLMTVYRFLPL